jgi:hypothetical protein
MGIVFRILGSISVCHVTSVMSCLSCHICHVMSVMSHLSCHICHVCHVCHLCRVCHVCHVCHICHVTSDMSRLTCMSDMYVMSRLSVTYVMSPLSCHVCHVTSVMQSSHTVNSKYWNSQIKNYCLIASWPFSLWKYHRYSFLYGLGPKDGHPLCKTLKFYDFEPIHTTFVSSFFRLPPKNCSWKRAFFFPNLGVKNIKITGSNEED